MSKIFNASDRPVWILVIGFLLLSLLIEGTTGQMEVARGQREVTGGAAAQWLFEITSHLGILLATILIPLALRQFPLSVTNVLRRLPIYLWVFLAFTVLHILTTVAMRHAVWPFITEGRYEFGLLHWEPWAYEMRKDFFTFLLICSMFLTHWEIAQLRLEARSAREDAKRTGKLSLKSGGRALFLPAADIVYARSDGNYCHIVTSSGRHHARTTLGDLTDLLSEAGSEPVRLHRSYLTTRDRIQEIRPERVILNDETELPLGRAYRADVRAALQA